MEWDALEAGHDRLLGAKRGYESFGETPSFEQRQPLLLVQEELRSLVHPARRRKICGLLVLTTLLAFLSSMVLAHATRKSEAAKQQHSDHHSVEGNATERTCACLFPAAHHCSNSNASRFGCLTLPRNCFQGTTVCAPPRECLCDATTIDDKSATIVCGNDEFALEAHVPVCPMLDTPPPPHN